MKQWECRKEEGLFMKLMPALVCRSLAAVPLAGRRRAVLALALLAIGMLLVPGCDTGSRNDDTDGGGIITPPGGGGGGGLTQPIFFGLSEGDENLCVGEVITLVGVNFSQTLSRNRVVFRSGRTVVEGTPVAVFFPTDNNSRDGLDSRLRVLVPTGVVTGSIELEVGGIFAGGSGYVACPMIYGYTIGTGGQPGDEAALQHNGILGFDPTLGPETVMVHGVNFDEVSEIQLEDDSRNRATLTAANFQRRTLSPDNGMDNLLFQLRGVRLGLSPSQPNRGSIKVQLFTDNARSNVVSVPVQPQDEFTDNNAPLGPCINGVIIPTGVRAGKVRIRYCFYDHPITVPYQMVFEWSVDQTNWFRAATPPDGVDPLNDGDFQVTPGHNGFGAPAGLVRGGGALRIFTWDAPNDANFRNVNNAVGTTGSAAPRGWIVSFRVRAVPMDTENNTRFDPGILFVTPPMAYFDLEDRPGDTSMAESRAGSFVEDFTTVSRRETVCRANQDPLVDECTTALWGPPFNVGNVEGSISDPPPARFGEGTEDVELVALEPPGTVTREYFIINTTRLQIDRIVEANGDVVSFPVFPNRVENISNPGEALGEFHMRSLLIGGGDVQCEGDRPLVIRLSGSGDDGDVVFSHEGNLLANGSAATDAAGAGGAGVLGSGNGGNGANATVGPGARGGMGAGYQLLRASAGGLGGGEPGDSPLAAGPQLTAISRVLGAPGGGGGARQAGGNGQPGPSTPTLYKLARAGRGGTPRGSEKLIRLVPGSGGGGGGAGLTRQPNAPTPVDMVQVTQGGGGGGGGGAIQISGLGSVVITGSIQCNGGDGFTTTRNGGPGGGGSGGSILIEASGLARVGCGNLQVNGGRAGTASTMNTTPGSGNGSPGWIRVNSRGGGLPFCGVLSVETALTERVSNSLDPNLQIRVQDVSQFPDSGVIIIEDEVIRYDTKSGNAFTRLTRGLRGSRVVEHAAGVTVALDAAILPGAALAGATGVQPTPDPIDVLDGLDGVLHCFFQPSLDPETGEVLLDAEGNQVSIWSFDTDNGLIRDPRGAIVKTAIGWQTNPGLMQLTQLRIDPGVTLRGIGRNALELVVTSTADIGGAIDVSGEDGTPLIFDSNSPTTPLPGEGGAGGPGGNAGGQGGTVIFLDGDPTHRQPENVEPVHGEDGELPPELTGGGDTPLPVGADRPAGGGVTLRDARCETPNNTCTNSAGGAGGGGHLSDGANGSSQPGNLLAGAGGSAYGTDNLRKDGELLLLGGAGGGGGGASLALSALYKAGNAGPGVFRGQALYGPGTGGGGGAGALRLTVGGALILRSGSRILANGGYAYQSIDLAGNGGGGAGGTVLVQVVNALTIEAGAKIEARGGRANSAVPVPRGQIFPLYPGNMRGGVAFGGTGGDGSPGRIRLEAPLNSLTLTSGSNPNFGAGLTLVDVERSVAFSRPIRLGIGPGSGVLSQDLSMSSPTIIFSRFGQPAGTDSDVLWDAAMESLDVFGLVGPFFGGVRDPDVLRELDYSRFQILFLSNYISFETATIRQVEIDYELD
jgi:hypothetical protein